MLDIRQMRLFCLEYRLSKHKMTICSENLRGHGPSAPPLTTPVTGSHHCRSFISINLADNFHCNSAESKIVLVFSKTFALVVCSSSQNSNSSLKSPAWIYLTKTSYSVYEVTSIDSCTTKGYFEMLPFHLLPGLAQRPIYLKCTSE